MDDPGIQSLRRSPFSGSGDLGSVFSQLDSIASIPMSATEDLGLTPENVSFIQNGVSNGDLLTPSPDATVNLDDITNKLPGWSFVQSSGTAITAKWASNVITFTVIAGAAGDDSYLEQIVSIDSATAAYFTATWAFAETAAPTTSNVIERYLKAAYLDSAGTAVGSEVTYAVDCTSGFGVLIATPGAGDGYTPTGALYLRLRMGLRRASAATSAVNTVVFSRAWITRSDSLLLLPDQSDVATYGVGYINQASGILTVSPGTGSYVRLGDGVRMSGPLAFVSVRYANVTSTKDDYSPTGWQDCSILALNPDAARTITGFAAPTGSVEGTIRVIHNVDAVFSITLSHADAASSASNRILGANGANVVIRPYGSVTLMWLGESDGSNLRWRMVSQV